MVASLLTSADILTRPKASTSFRSAPLLRRFAPMVRDFAQSFGGMRHLMTTGAEVIANGIDEASMSFPAVISTADVDRVGDVLVPEGCDFRAYSENALVFLNHQSEHIPIGTCWDSIGKFYFAVEPDRVLARCFCVQGGEYGQDAADIFHLVVNRAFNDVSVGFNPHPDPRYTQALDTGGKRYQKWEVLEWGPVGIGCNRAAKIIRKYLSDGRITGKHISPALTKMLTPLAEPKPASVTSGFAAPAAKCMEGTNAGKPGPCPGPGEQSGGGVESVRKPEPAKVGEMAFWHSVDGKIHVGKLEDMDNGTAVVRMPDGSLESTIADQPLYSAEQSLHMSAEQWADANTAHFLAKRPGVPASFARDAAKREHAQLISELALAGVPLPDARKREYPYFDIDAMQAASAEAAAKLSQQQEAREGIRQARETRKRELENFLNGDKKERAKHDAIASQMTLADYLRQRGYSQGTIDRVLSAKVSARGRRVDQETESTLVIPGGESAYLAHYNAVAAMVNAGKKVPPAVLSEYPDLAKIASEKKKPKRESSKHLWTRYGFAPTQPASAQSAQTKRSKPMSKRWGKPGRAKRHEAKHIRHEASRPEGHQWVLYSHDMSKVLGTHPTREAAEAQERAAEAHKNLNSSSGTAGGYAVAEEMKPEEKPEGADHERIKGEIARVMEEHKGGDPDYHHAYYKAETGEVHHTVGDVAEEGHAEKVKAGLEGIDGVKEVHQGDEHGPKGEGYEKVFPPKAEEEEEEEEESGEAKPEEKAARVARRKAMLAFHVGRGKGFMVAAKALPKAKKDALETCVHAKIPKIAEDHPEMEDDQRVAVAYSLCGEKAFAVEVKTEDLTAHVRKKIADGRSPEQATALSMSALSGSRYTLLSSHPEGEERLIVLKPV